VELPEPMNLYQTDFSPNFGNKDANPTSKVNLIETNADPFIADLNQPQIMITKNAFASLGEVAEASHESQTQGAASRFASLIDDEKTFSNKYQTNNDD